ncbi:terpene cyclase/mutase family protein [Akkermansiaceae bacterium]|nr:terpene cyclase/mutase family protein [Akkermansiaceae bacterium]MDC0274969.1 terpene cyclase/mutase family protein [Akkermansiaceae bacterium]
MRLLLSTLLLSVTLPLFGQSVPRREEDPIPAKVENIYNRGLRFLAQSQNAEGAWDDSQGKEPGVVGLCIMAFLAHGEDPNHGPYAENIQKGINFILADQKESNGYIGNSMYSHGFATLALAECYGMFRDERIAPALRKAVDLILSAQKRNGKGAWRYNPESSDADSTVSGAQIVALYAARNAGIPVPDAAFAKAAKYMAKCRGSDGSYGYTTSHGGKPTLTAIGLLCQALAKQHESRPFKASTKYLSKRLNYREKYYPYYFEYYMSQALFHADEKVWEKWNVKNIAYMGVLQSRDGSFPGNKGKAFSTSGALLSLALNYRFLPIYEK